MQRPQTAKIGPGQIEIQYGESQLQGNNQANQEPDDAPKGGGDRAGTDDAVFIAVRIGQVISPLLHQHDADDEEQRHQTGVKTHHGVTGLDGKQQRCCGAKRQDQHG